MNNCGPHPEVQRLDRMIAGWLFGVFIVCAAVFLWHKRRHEVVAYMGARPVTRADVAVGRDER